MTFYSLKLFFFKFIRIIFLSLLIFSLNQSNNFAFAVDLFVTQNGSGETCSQNTPCELSTGISKANDGDTVFVAGIAGETYYGDGNNVIEITNSINLLGGWDGTTTFPVVRDPEAYSTILDGGETRRVILVGGFGKTPTIDGFTITNGNATGLVTDCWGESGSSPDGCGGGIFVYQANPVISNNEIINNIAAGETTPGGVVGYGGGIYIRFSNSAEIINNRFNGNIGSSVNYGEGGGLDVRDSGSGMQINDNHFYNNFATTFTTSSTGWGGGLAMDHYDGLLQNNIFENNTASPVPANAQGSGMFSWYGDANINNNTIIGNQNTHAVYLGHFDGTFQSNRILDNSTEHALYVADGDTPSITATIVNNIIEGTGTYTLYLDAFSGYPLTAVVKHNTIVGKESTYGVYIKDYCTVSMTNNIVSNHTNGVTLAFMSGATSYLTQNNTLFYGNTSNGELGTNSVIGDPAFKDFDESNYSIKGNSAARDAGIDAGITADIEGTARPKGSGYDIGAYEFYSAINAGMLLMLLN